MKNSFSARCKALESIRSFFHIITSYSDKKVSKKYQYQ